MNVQHYKDRLLELEKTLSARIGRTVADAGREFIDSAHDVGEAGVADEAASEEFADADRDSIVLTQVRDALARVENGTFGACLVDGGPIEEKRLDAVPWTPYCLKHEGLIEAANLSRNLPPA
jgi:DnaK suppressor protein